MKLKQNEIFPWRSNKSLRAPIGAIACLLSLAGLTGCGGGGHSSSPSDTGQPADRSLPSSVAYQLNPAHTGSVTFGKALTFPSKPTWSVTLDGPVSYPIIADGRVFITAKNSSGKSGTSLYALDAANGRKLWGPVDLGGTGYWSALTYENGQVFALNVSGLLQAFDAVTGETNWRAGMTGQYQFSAAPTAVGGVVYVGGAGIGGTLYAVEEKKGFILWKASVESGDTSSPAVSTDNSSVFVSYCQVYGFSTTSGARIWHDNDLCEGIGATSVYANGQLYVRNNGGMIYNASTGAAAGAFTSNQIPAIGEKTGFFMNNRTLQGIDLATRKVLWSFSGDGTLTTAPIVIDQTVIVGSSSGQVFAVNADTGAQIWNGSAGASIPFPSEGAFTQPSTGFAAGEGYLLVPAGSTLTAWKITAP